MQNRWGWLLLSVALAETVNLGLILVAWILHRHEPTWKVISTWIVRIQRQPWASQIRLLYAVGLPAFAYLGQGALTARGLGLQTIAGEITEANEIVSDWATDLGWAFLVTAMVWLLLMIGRSQTGEAHRNFELNHGPASLREAIYHEAHWAFYREPFVLTLGLGLGIWIGAAVPTLEALTNPAWWADMHAVRSRESIVNYGALLIASALLYGLTRNLWVTVLADFILRWSLGIKPPTQAIRIQPEATSQENQSFSDAITTIR
jgi:hypothetical protein